MITLKRRFQISENNIGNLKVEIFKKIPQKSLLEHPWLRGSVEEYPATPLDMHERASRIWLRQAYRIVSFMVATGSRYRSAQIYGLPQFTNGSLDHMCRWVSNKGIPFVTVEPYSPAVDGFVADGIVGLPQGYGMWMPSPVPSSGTALFLMSNPGNHFELERLREIILKDGIVADWEYRQMRLLPPENEMMQLPVVPATSARV